MKGHRVSCAVPLLIILGIIIFVMHQGSRSGDNQGFASSRAAGPSTLESMTAMVAPSDGFKVVGMVYNNNQRFLAPLMGRRAPYNPNMYQYYVMSNGVQVDVRRGGVNSMDDEGCYKLRTGDEIQVPEIGLRTSVSMYGDTEKNASMESRDRGIDLSSAAYPIAMQASMPGVGF